MHIHQTFFTKNTRNEPRRANIIRVEGKTWWRNAFRNWDKYHFCEKFRINRETFIFILNIIQHYFVKTSNNFFSWSHFQYEDFCRTFQYTHFHFLLKVHSQVWHNFWQLKVLQKWWKILYLESCFYSQDI